MKNIIITLSALILMASCASKKDVIYYQDIDERQFQNVNIIKPKPKIEINDILQVDIKTLDEVSAIPFRKQPGGQVGQMNMQPGMINLQGYIVNEFGEIEMPIIGRIQVNNLTREQAERKIKEKLDNYLKDPYVSVRVVNYKFTIQGEIARPGTYEVFDPNLTILQALGMAGDLTIRGRRDNILIIRTNGSERIVRRIDLTKSDWMNSPFYFIKQNDYIYIEPNNPQVKTAGFITNVGTLISAISFLTSLALIFVTVR
jgi:polysaccharide export outer membrane protein